MIHDADDCDFSGLKHEMCVNGVNLIYKSVSVLS